MWKLRRRDVSSSRRGTINIARIYVLPWFPLLIPPEKSGAREDVLSAMMRAYVYVTWLASRFAITPPPNDTLRYSPIRLQPFVQRGQKNDADHRADHSLRVVCAPAAKQDGFGDAAVKWHLQGAIGSDYGAMGHALSKSRVATLTPCILSRDIDVRLLPRRLARTSVRSSYEEFPVSRAFINSQITYRTLIV